MPILQLPIRAPLWSMVWNLLEHDSLRRLSGLKYLRELVHVPEFRRPGNTFWIMAVDPPWRKDKSQVAWLKRRRSGYGELRLPCAHVHQWPGQPTRKLVEMINALRPPALSSSPLASGVQECLAGHCAKSRRLNYLPAIHCIGAAHRIPQRRPGAYPDVGRQALSRLAVPVCLPPLSGSSAVLADSARKKLLSFVDALHRIGSR